MSHPARAHNRADYSIPGTWYVSFTWPPAVNGTYIAPKSSRSREPYHARAGASTPRPPMITYHTLPAYAHGNCLPFLVGTSSTYRVGQQFVCVYELGQPKSG